MFSPTDFTFEDKPKRLYCTYVIEHEIHYETYYFCVSFELLIVTGPVVTDKTVTDAVVTDSVATETDITGIIVQFEKQN